MNSVVHARFLHTCGCVTCRFLSLENAPATDRKDLLSELELMKSLKPHPHVIKLLGCVTETGTADHQHGLQHSISWNEKHVFIHDWYFPL